MAADPDISVASLWFLRLVSVIVIAVLVYFLIDAIIG